MKTKIKSLTVVNQQGSRTYCIGNEYNGLMLDRIEDKSLEYPDAITIIYVGLTQDGEYVFEVINAPVDVMYMEDKELCGPPTYTGAGFGGKM